MALTLQRAKPFPGNVGGDAQHGASGSPLATVVTAAVVIRLHTSNDATPTAQGEALCTCRKRAA